jgi:two-component system, response regulator PdtaR
MIPVKERRAILVVEDESLLRWRAMDVVEEAGFAALEASNADDALRILAAHSDIKALFTDINMPGTLDGLELAQFVHDRYPHIKLIITSGKAAPSDDEIPDDGVFLSKPYSTADVARYLENVVV